MKGNLRRGARRIAPSCFVLIATICGCDEHALSSRTASSDCTSPTVALVGDFVIATEEDMAMLIPAGDECFSITGDLTIAETNLTHVEGLRHLISIGGDLRIRFNSALTSLAGLENLSNIDGGLRIRFNDHLPSLRGLNNLTGIHGDLHISFNDELASIEALSGLTGIGEDLDIFDCDALASLKGLERLSSVGGFLQIGDNRQLMNVEALGALTRIGGSLRIVQNQSLKSLDAFDRLTQVGGFTIENNPMLATQSAQALADRLRAGGFAGEVIIDGNQT